MSGGRCNVGQQRKASNEEEKEEDELFKLKEKARESRVVVKKTEGTVSE